jgi:hypothetical protein
MKRFWLVLLSLGLVMAFSVSAFAVDVKVSAEYYAAGLYLNKVTVDDGFEAWQGNRGSVQPSTAFFYQRLRVGTDFVLSPSLKMVTRFDVMERIWGGARGGNDGGLGGADSMSAGTKEENQNIAFDLVYIDYTSPIGLFRVGYQPDYEWGTVFGNRTSGKPAGIITYATVAGPVTLIAQYAKEQDNSYSYVNSGYAYTTDKDYDSYRLGAIYNFKNSKASGEVGGLLLWERDASNKNSSVYGLGYLTNAYKLIPYFKANVGPVALQGEFEYTFGDAIKWEDTDIYGAQTNVTIGAISAWLDATANLGMFYVGGTVAYLSGDDPGTSDKLEGGSLTNTSGLDWNPCLILFNTNLNYWSGDIYGHSSTVVNQEMSNAWFGQLRAGVKPTPQWDVMLAVAYAQVDKKPSGISGGTYGTEVDLTGTYKITNNLSYMLGVGYLFTGDYFKGYNYDFGAGSSKVNDDYILINKLTLSF